MREKLDLICIAAKNRYYLTKERMKEETGVSGMVAAVILVLIAVVIASVFWERISTILNRWFGTIDTESGGIGNKGDL